MPENTSTADAGRRAGAGRRVRADRTAGTGRIGEIDGLRGVALTLVVLFHVFGAGRVSGGVDVFLVITGFLTTRAVLRRATTGRLTVPGAWSRDLVRLAPTALVVLLAVAGGMLALLPPWRWENVLREVAASATSWENWRLIDAELAYGAAGPGTSPLQHFWSLAVQVQYLAALPVVALGCVMLAARIRRVRGRRITPERLFGALLGVVTAGSLGYAVWLTSVAQPVAYLDTSARIWEIGAGGLLALAVGRVRLSPALRGTAGWAGLSAVVGCGFLLDGGRLFPGPATLLPVVGALLVLLAADAGEPRTAGTARPGDSRPGLFTRVLGGPLPRRLATISYALYLWHWPLLIAWLAFTGRSRAGVLDGAAVVSVSVLLAWATVRWVARPVERRTARPVADAGRSRPRRRLPVRTAALLGTASLVLAGGAWASADGLERGRGAALAALTEPSAAHPGAAVLRTGWSQDAGRADVPFRPSTAIGGSDGRHLTDCANGDRTSSEVVTCVIAAPEAGEPTRRVYLVGGSHTQHWEDAWVQVADDAGWELTAMIKHGCRLTVGQEASHRFCVEWSADALARVIAERPDVVVVESTKTSTEGTDVVVPEQAAAWEAVTDAGIQVVGVRDTPRFTERVPSCLWSHQHLPRDEAVAACSVPREDLFGTGFPAVSPGAGSAVPGTATPGPATPGIVHLDLTDAICGPDTCDVVVGNVLVYRDHDHLTGTYAETLGPDLDAAVRTAAPWLFE
ncbi:acyltransferase family protein [Myceligenerans xiligouense]|uniref:Peptidoglycan/LPS O-acetylase OafA/YrhL n=1 Tax=Myceligenerans xiligouense TaxID=253184 RepID=A0A3N4YRI3_9MICO|nr:acyltransferase family protein [Myceligenerans xiligouense]RPF21140.1 peptidoglycan/LPS O-acetylase OafA/YrhL [Myceligenerans xiligouense]